MVGDFGCFFCLLPSLSRSASVRCVLQFVYAWCVLESDTVSHRICICIKLNVLGVVRLFILLFFFFLIPNSVMFTSEKRNMNMYLYGKSEDDILPRRLPIRTERVFILFLILFIISISFSPMRQGLFSSNLYVQVYTYFENFVYSGLRLWIRT